MNANQNQRYEVRVGFPGYEGSPYGIPRMAFPGYEVSRVGNLPVYEKPFGYRSQEEFVKRKSLNRTPTTLN